MNPVEGVDRTFSKAVVSAARAVDGILDVRFHFFGYDNMLGILW
jgi:hypothetical protein